MTIPEAIKAWLVADATINASLAGRVHYQYVPESSDGSRIWFSLANRDEFEGLEQDPDDPAIYTFDVELVGEAFGHSLIELVRRRLIALDATYEGVNFQGVFVEDADDSYIYKSVGEEDPIFSYALQITLVA